MTKQIKKKKGGGQLFLNYLACVFFLFKFVHTQIVYIFVDIMRVTVTYSLGVEVREEFKRVCLLQGFSMSGVVSDLMVEFVRESILRGLVVGVVGGVGVGGVDGGVDGGAVGAVGVDGGVVDGGVEI